MEKRIVWSNGNGGVGVFIPAPKFLAKFATEDEGLSAAALQVVPEGITHKVIGTDKIPAEKDFRDAWKLSGSAVVVDMPKAREIHMSRIRIARNKKLESLDVEQLKGMDVDAEKQVLRDIPETFDLSVAATPEELKALWPEELK